MNKHISLTGRLVNSQPEIQPPPTCCAPPARPRDPALALTHQDFSCLEHRVLAQLRTSTAL